MQKISIITPSFNQGKYIEQTIDSVLSQNYPNLEYIIIDGGSKDNSVEIIKKYEKYLTYWISENDNGQSHAINKGLKIATGNIVNWLNSDDHYTENTLLKVGKAFENKATNVFSGRSRILENEIEIRQNKGTDIYASLEKTIGFARIDQPETFFRKSCIDKIGLLNENLHYVMDRDWWIRYLLLFGLNGIEKTSDILVNFRSHPTSKTNSFLEKFDTEAHTVYYTIAKQHELAESMVFENIWQTKELANAGYPTILDKNQLQQSIHYYFLQIVFIAYAKNEYVLAKKLMQYIQPDILEKEDAIELEKIKTRIKYLPAWLKKILNKR